VSDNELRSGESLTDLLQQLEAKGFTANMVPVEGGLVGCKSCGKESPADEFESTGILRAEGVSDPDDMVAAVGLTCPVCGAKGTLIVHYGAEASIEEGDVLRLLHTQGRRGN